MWIFTAPLVPDHLKRVFSQLINKAREAEYEKNKAKAKIISTMCFKLFIKGVESLLIVNPKMFGIPQVREGRVIQVLQLISSWTQYSNNCVRTLSVWF